MTRRAEPGGLVVRVATVDDLDHVVRIERESFGDPWSRSSFQDLLDLRRVWFAVAERGDPPVLVGYAILLAGLGEADLLNLAIDPAARGAGLGSRLLDATLAEAAARGIGEVFLEVRDSNVAARALYESRGFREVGRRKKYYRHPREDGLILRWTAAGAADAAG